MFSKRLLQRLIPMLAIAGWMLLAHPYLGIRHDGVLYLGQTLLHSRVPALSQDPFFAGGSQDSYSIYAHLMMPLYAQLGVETTDVAVLLMGWLLMAAAVLTLLRRFEPAGTAAWWGLLAFAVMSPIYGGSWVFSYGESFVTARSFAEPLLLWSLVALINSRLRWTFALQVLAALFHPLMALPIIAVSWCYLVEADRRWLWLLAALPLPLVAAFAGVPPWAGLLTSYDPYWWALVETGNRQVLLANWTLEDKLGLLLDLAILLAATRLRRADGFSRLIYAVVVTTLALVSFTALGADVLHAVLPTQLQLWRVHWIAHLLAMGLAPWLVMRLWQQGGLWPASACALSLALLNAHIGTQHGTPALALWALSSLAAWRTRRISQTTVWAACTCTLLCVAALSAYQIDSLLQQQHWQSPGGGWRESFIAVAAFPTAATTGFAFLIWTARRSRAGAAAALCLSAVLMGVSAFSWDQRPDLARAIESPAPGVHPFIGHLPAHASVYWPTQLLPVWGLLERPSHYAAQQGAGVLFNRDTGLIFGPRKEMYRRINEDRERCLVGASLAKNLTAQLACEMPSRERLDTLCQQADAPDFLVLSRRLNVPPLATWQPPVRRDPPQSYALYACSQLNTPGS